MERARPPADITPTEFFTEWIPAAVARDGIRRQRLGDTEATIEFCLAGEAGGTFVVRVSNGTVHGSPGPAEIADLRVRLDVTTWRMLNNGEVSAPEALLRRRLTFEGSFLLGLKLHLILG